MCVSEPVPEPTVTVECVEKGVNLSCDPFKGANEDKKHTKKENSNNGNQNDGNCLFFVTKFLMIIFFVIEEFLL